MVNTGKPSMACRVCLKRRIKCDQRRPSCGQCAKSSWVCTGYRAAVDVLIRDETQRIVSRGQVAVSSRILENEFTEQSKTSSDTLIHSSPSIRPALEITLVERAIAFFFSQYVYRPSLCPERLERGYCEYLPLLYTQSRSNGPLAPIVQAAAIASLANAGKASAWLEKSYRLYSLAMERTRYALCDAAHAKGDDLLATVMLLATYENIVLDGRNAMKAWSRHVIGASNLMEFRGPDQFQNKASIHMFLQVRRLIIISAYQMRQSIPFSLEKWAEWLEAAQLQEDAISVRQANRLSEIVHTLASQRALLSQARIRGPGRALSIFLQVDDRLQSWRDQLPLSCRPRPHQASADENHSFRACPDGGLSEIYPDLFIASLWNNYRGARLLIYEHIYTLRDSDFLKNSSQQNVTSRAGAVLHQMSTEICSSVEYHLDPSIGDLSIRSRGRSLGHSRSGIPGGELLIWPLFMAGKLPTTSLARRTWIAGHLARIGTELGNRTAISLAEDLRSSLDSTTFSKAALWDYNRNVD